MIISGSENKRIAKNTAFMYIRMFFTVIFGLYTSRAVLAALGFDDYGLFNVIGGVIAMFGFINGAMTNTTSRYITFYLGKNNNIRLQEVFSTSFYIHVIIAVLIVVLGETVGLWYVCNKLVVPEGRFYIAMCLYQFTIITTAANIISVPFNASIIAYEHMSTFAIIAIVDSVLKLIIAISLAYVPFDRLLYYGIMILILQIINNVIYWLYSFKKFDGVRIRRVFDKEMFSEMFSFTGWNLFGNFSYLFFTQGVNLILNFFCGTSVNAARGIAVQVEGIIRQFATNVQTAINPQIIKSYSCDDKERFFSLIFASSRYCFYLLFLLTLPIILEADFLLTLWLGEFPQHTVNFLRITLVIVTLESLATPMFMANLASGKVKLYQTVMSVLSFVFIPITIMSIKYLEIPEIVFACTLILTIVEIVARIFIVHRQVGLSRRIYSKVVLLKISIVVALASIIPTIAHFCMFGNVGRFLVVGLLSFLSTVSVVYFVGINQREREFVKSLIIKRICKCKL